MYDAALSFLLSLGFTFLILPVLMDQMRKRGIVGRDVHKKEKPEVPEMGGIAILAALSISTVILAMFYPEKSRTLVGFLGTTLIAGFVGAIDDWRNLNARAKPFLTLFASVPILFLGTYAPSIFFPFIGGTRLTLVYPMLIPIVMAVTSNAINMMDPFNGVMAGSSTIITLMLLLSAIMLRNNDAVFLCSLLLGTVMAFFYFNKFPSKVFSGDVGSLSVGAALGAIAVIGKLEVPAVVAFMPQIMNAFYGISTIGRLYERREVARPVEILEDGRLMARDDPKAPLTLARFVLARGPLRENEAALIFFALSALSGLLAVITTCLMVVIF